MYFDISEKTEKRIKIAINCFLVFVALMAVVFVWSSSRYSENDHKLEQGELPVYITPPTQVKTEEEYDNVDLTKYRAMSYNRVLEACTKNSTDQIVFEATVYSVMETQSSVIYNLADADGNYYSVVDQSGGKLLKCKKATVIRIYGVPNGVSNLNNKEIPKLKAYFIEKVE